VSPASSQHDPHLATPAGKPRARAVGLKYRGTPGPHNAITDVPGVEVGYQTLIEGDRVRTGVTAIHPRGKHNPGDPLAAGKTVEKTIHELNADLVVFDITTLELREQIASFGQRVAGTFVGAFGLLALVLAAVGIYGVTSYTTRQRTHEIGIRMTLGASKRDVLRLVLGHGLRLTLIGVVLGLAASFALTRFLTSLLLGVTSTDALTFSSVALLLCAVALFACFIPARRAMRVDPMVALRYE